MQPTVSFGMKTFQIENQPGDQPAYVDPKENVMTLFAGDDLLAHNTTSAGRAILTLKIGDIIRITDSAGKEKIYVVYQRIEAQAVRPYSPYSDFICDGILYTYVEVYQMTYGRPNRLILQTCLSRDGSPSWGRLFIIAKPYSYITY